MGTPLIIDNWLLQDIGNSLASGLVGGNASEVVINQAEDSHYMLQIPEAGVRLEALLGLLVDIVFRDSLVVDSDFTGTWAAYTTDFAPLLDSGLVRAIPFNMREEDLSEARRYVLSKLCITSTLREEQRRNEESWAAGKGAANPYMSAVVWGTAGMVGRSHVYEAPYSGHPLRKRVIEQTILANPKRDAITETLDWVNSERLRIFESRARDGSQKTATLILPPVAMEIIEEAQDVQQLIPVAYQLRDKYAKMREWMNSVQMAIDSEDPKALGKYKKLLSAVSKDIDRAIGDADAGQVSLSIGTGWPSVSISLGTIGNVRKRFGMRATLNNQIYSAQGEKTVKRLLRMFGEERSSVGLKAQDYLRTRGSE